MKPVCILQFSPTEGPGYLADYLSRAGIPWHTVRIDQGEAVPHHAGAVSGLAMMGGPMSVNDDLPWIPQVLALVRQAVALEVPVIGHCLGGQLLAKALGGSVTDNPCAEVGWLEVEVADPLAASHWFGDLRRFTTFQWHYQTFSLPAGAVRLLQNRYCENQAFCIGPHIGFQSHIEMKSDIVQTWCAESGALFASFPESPSVQQPADILGNLEARVAALNHVAAGIYRNWLRNVHSGVASPGVPPGDLNGER